MHSMNTDDEEDESVFNDELDDLEIAKILDSKRNNRDSSSRVGSVNGGSKGVQRDLYGNKVELQSSEPMSSPSNGTGFPPTHHTIDYETLKTYIYPTNFPVRDYQFNIVQRALYDNTLVALPTGLGKTFIASTVMLNFSRWFPEAKIIFMAPTKPLVAQQIKACLGITGIVASKVAIFLDKTKRNRQDIWDTHSIFFTTPQVVENDLTTGFVDPKLIALLVIDEAHRAKGNYAYNSVVKFVNRFNTSYRILALTATPASDVEGVQEIIDNLSISKVEVRTERSIDISKYMKKKTIERISVTQSPEIIKCIDLICSAIKPTLKLANERKIFDITDPLQINAFQAMEASQRLMKNPTMLEGLKWLNYFILQLLNIVGQSLRRLNIYGIRSFYNYFSEKHKEFTIKYNNKKSTNKTAAQFYHHDNIKKLLTQCEALLSEKGFMGHPKLEVIARELSGFFKENNRDSKAIVFTEFRESALDIVNILEGLGNNLRPHIFIGQAREKEKFDEDKFLSRRKKKKGKNDLEKSDVSNASSRLGTRTSSEDAQIRGMNQKLQKELIQKFKHGEYNILVATSIGEEGLDIGEVDLIICFDSTSSPIKNIQRMGRTGRKRDGKIILLFASNEEKKFDKAVEGYEYIQSHIMNNKLISLSQSDRIIPKKYKPIVETCFIDIPRENEQIKVEEDEDEIIRIATSYMNESTKLNTQTHTKAKPKKPTKKFFMPSNVETGFQTAIIMLQGKTPQQHHNSRDDSEEFDKPEEENDLNGFESEHLVPQETKEMPPDAPDRGNAGNGPHVSTTKKRGLTKDADFTAPNSISMPGTEGQKLRAETTPTPKKTLGLKKRRSEKVLTSPFLSSKPYHLTPLTNITNSDLPSKVFQADDVFDDDLDEELSKAEALARKGSTFKQEVATDSLCKNIFHDSDGILNEQEKLELYTAYYSPVSLEGMPNFYDPSAIIGSSGSRFTGIVGHSSRSNMLFNLFDTENAE